MGDFVNISRLCAGDAAREASSGFCLKYEIYLLLYSHITQGINPYNKLIEVLASEIQT